MIFFLIIFQNKLFISKKHFKKSIKIKYTFFVLIKIYEDIRIILKIIKIQFNLICEINIG